MNTNFYHIDVNGNITSSSDDVPGGTLPETGEELIERMEREAGCRVDSNGFDNRAVGGIMAAMARALGKNPHPPELDIIAGELIRHNMGASGARERERGDALATLLRAGGAPEDLVTLSNLLRT